MTSTVIYIVKHIRQNLNILLILACLASLTSCEETTNWHFQKSEPVVVVDALITNELKNHAIYIYYSAAGPNEPITGVSGARVILKTRLDTYRFTEDLANPGTYISAIPFRGAAGIVWQLSIEVNGTTSNAEARMVAITPLPDPEIVVQDSLFRFIYTDDEVPSMTNIRYNWSEAPGYCSVYGACEAAETFYTLHDLDVNEIFAAEKQVIPFPAGTVIYRSKYSLSAEHQQFIRALLIETEWRGGIFDTEQGNVPTNFNNDFRGWFAMCMVLRDTIRVE